MKCPHCEKEISGIPCPKCGESAPEGAKYCMSCGALMEKKAAAPADDTDSYDLENRVLCPDGTCTGIVIKGHCTDCGKTPDEAEKAGEG
jgi:zinc ribbon protein